MVNRRSRPSAADAPRQSSVSADSEAAAADFEVAAADFEVAAADADLEVAAAEADFEASADCDPLGDWPPELPLLGVVEPDPPVLGDVPAELEAEADGLVLGLVDGEDGGTCGVVGFDGGRITGGREVGGRDGGALEGGVVPLLPPLLPVFPPLPVFPLLPVLPPPAGGAFRSGPGVTPSTEP